MVVATSFLLVEWLLVASIPGVERDRGLGGSDTHAP